MKQPTPQQRLGLPEDVRISRRVELDRTRKISVGRSQGMAFLSTGMTHDDPLGRDAIILKQDTYERLGRPRKIQVTFEVLR